MFCFRPAHEFQDDHYIDDDWTASLIAQKYKILP